jgi:hypothetical protein
MINLKGYGNIGEAGLHQLRSSLKDKVQANKANVADLPESIIKSGEMGEPQVK